eukprot:6662254-Pyramimonas_sp.AAC.1
MDTWADSLPEGQTVALTAGPQGPTRPQIRQPLASAMRPAGQRISGGTGSSPAHPRGALPQGTE